jgi:2-phospho-L-lactate transferase/gluconeogenesis factor (CofD/UPF0052 family)
VACRRFKVETDQHDRQNHQVEQTETILQIIAAAAAAIQALHHMRKLKARVLPASESSPYLRMEYR